MGRACVTIGSMTTPAGGPSGPNTPPPPGSPYGQTPQTPGQPGPYGQPGHGGQGGPPPGNFGGPTGGPGGQPPKKGPGKGLIAGIAGGVALILLLCCIGGFFVLRGDDEESSSSSSTSQSTSESSTSEPTSESSTTEPTSETTSEPTSETSSESSSAAGGGDFPDEFDGWKKGKTSDAAGQVTAVYTKGSDTISVVSSDAIKPSDFEAVWDKDEKVGDYHCGSMSSTMQCAGEKGGTTYLITSVTKKTSKDVSEILGKYLDAV